MKKWAFVALALISSTAFAVYATVVRDAWWFQSGVYISPSSTAATSATRNAVTATYESASFDWDFASLAADACATTTGVTITGAALGDWCGVSQTTDLHESGATTVFTCRVSSANTAVIRACANGTATDGGSTDLPDASYVVRTLR